MATVFSSTSGRSGNRSAISGADLKYSPRSYFIRLSSSRSLPSPMQRRTSWASWFSGFRKWASFVATTGSERSSASVKIRSLSVACPSLSWACTSR
jgi:hypothetical protein